MLSADITRLPLESLENAVKFCLNLRESLESSATSREVLPFELLDIELETGYPDLD